MASSDASNIEASIKEEDGSYVINGHKWWISGIWPEIRLPNSVCVGGQASEAQCEMHGVGGLQGLLQAEL